MITQLHKWYIFNNLLFFVVQHNPFISVSGLSFSMSLTVAMVLISFLTVNCSCLLELYRKMLKSQII